MEIIIPGQTDLITGERPLYQAKDVKRADFLIDLKIKNQGDVWPVIDAVVNMWMEKHETTWKATIIEIEQEKDTRATKYGSNKAKSLRQTVDIPMWIEGVIRRLYSVDELPFDKEWYKQLWRRYPAFRVAESY